MRNFYLSLVCMFFSMISLEAQFEFKGQIVQRTEFRNGYNRLLTTNEQPASFIAHRVRVEGLYKKEKLSIFMSVQDVRTWGNTPQIKLSDGFLSVHEAWAAYQFTDRWSIKLGRQELNYDNFRFLGNLDWALQARAHDIALLKYEYGSQKLHLGAAYNQDGQFNSGRIYTIPNQYYNSLFARWEQRTDERFMYSLLIWREGVARQDPAGQTIYYTTTLGVPTLKYQINSKTEVSGFFYQQIGKDILSRDRVASNVSSQITRTLFSNDEKGSNLKILTGFEILSGTSELGDTKNRSYRPAYGTNHIFNGYMDLFYVGGAHEGSVGLNDYFVKLRWQLHPKLFFQTDFHWFNSNAALVSSAGLELPERHLGKEIDLSVGYIVHSSFSIQGGFSQFFVGPATRSRLSSPPDLKNLQNWAYLMLIFRPEHKNKFIGILF